MAGKIVELRKHRRFGTPESRQREMELARQLKRIKLLLDELEEMTEGVLPLLLLRLPSGGSGVGTRWDPPEDSDPQPDVDREILERMYRDLGVHE